jgi:hypothetical protein
VKFMTFLLKILHLAIRIVCYFYLVLGMILLLFLLLVLGIGLLWEKPNSFSVCLVYS